MRELTHLSLFTGIGGIDLAAEQAGFKTVGQCELAKIKNASGKLVDNHAYKLLEKRFPDVPKFDDVTKLNKEAFNERTGLRTVDLISGGYPCQPFSVAGKRGGEKDDRYFWAAMFRIIKELRPAFVLGENVAGHVSLGLDATLSDLESANYKARAFVIPACAVQAPHERSRVFIVAYDTARGFGKWKRDEKCTFSPWSDTECERICRFVSDTDGLGEQQPGGDKQESGGRACDGCKTERGGVLPNAVRNGRDETRELQNCESRKALGQAPGREPVGAGGKDRAVFDHNSKRHEPPQEKVCARRNAPFISGWWSSEPDVGRVVYGVPDRVDRLRELGNAVVPQQVYPILKAIAWILNEEEL
jgi:DNA (cytosine-5)-methyltransferase 1